MYSVYDLCGVKEFSRERPITPERELLIAILDRAVLDFCGRQGELHERASDWLFDSDGSDDLFSFDAICDHLGLSAEAVRARVRELNIPRHVSQAHRWLRKKVQSEKPVRNSSKQGMFLNRQPQSDALHAA